MKILTLSGIRYKPPFHALVALIFIEFSWHNISMNKKVLLLKRAIIHVNKKLRTSSQLFRNTEPTSFLRQRY